ncbi:MAG: T9SS type A sorting domain-containing protein, partial [Ginsengibacter sp.]
TGMLSFGKSNCTFNTNNHLTLKSTASATAGVADITNNGAFKGNVIHGDVTVERYINIGEMAGQHNKTWVMVATPTQGKTIYQTWMEGGDNSVAGYGTQITGKGTGFDASSVAPALKYYNDANNTYVGVTNTNDQVYNPLGYMLFVRGDRKTVYPNMSNTTLRTTGSLITGSTAPINVKAGKFQSIGNPYASAVDIRKMSASGINPDIIVWDPTLTVGNPYGVGAYQTLYKDGNNYRNLLASPTFGAAGTINNNIESGVAFFIQSFNTNGQVYFTESAKSSSVGKGIAMREQTTADDVAGLSARLFVVNPNGSSYVADGVLQQFSNQYSDDIDNMDTRKINNSAENLSIKVNGQNLVIERRSGLTPEDTISYQLTGVSNQKYRFIFTASGIENAAVNGFILDSYAKKETPLNSDGDTQVDFTVTSDAASKVANRFKIVFKTLHTAPVTFTSVKANAKNNQVAVEWNVENQSSMKQYEVERSADGNKFSNVAVIDANNNLTFAYSWLDESPLQGNNYYRIRSVDLNGKIEFTSVVKAQISNISVSIKVYPNPATEAKVNLQFNNQPAGVYYTRLINPIGQVIVSKKIIHSAGSSTETIQWNQNAAKGIYNLQISQPDGSMKVIRIEY